MGDVRPLRGTVMREAGSIVDQMLAEKQLLAYLNAPVRDGGSSPIRGFCPVGLVYAWWRAIGYRIEDVGSARWLIEQLRDEHIPAERLAAGAFGAIACYDGEDSVRICLSARIAMAAVDGFVQMRPIEGRDDLLGIWLPVYPWAEPG